MNWDTGVFERNALQLTDAGADWVSRWMAHRDAWTPAQLIGDLRAQGLLDGLDLQGPGGSRSPEDPLSVFHVAPDPSDVSTADGPVARRPYASFSIAEEAQTLVDLEGNRFEQRGRMLLVSLKEHLNTMFHLGRRHGIDAGDVQSLNFLSTSPRRILLQGNGRDVDLSAALGMQGVDEVVILPEGDDARRRLHVDEGTDADLRCAFNGRDLLLFDAARPSSPLIRVRDALRVGDHASGHALIADPRLTVLLHRSGSGQPLPTTHQWLDTPILTLHAGRMALQRDGGDLVARSSDGWDEERLSGFFDPDAPGNDAAKAPQDAALMVRLRGDAGGWAFGRLNNNNLLDMMAAQDAFGTPSSFDWSIDERADSRLRVPNLTTDAQGRVTAGTFKLQAALLSDYVAAMPPAASTDTVLRFLPEQELPSWAGAGPDFPSTNRHSFTAS
ncbi:hypothetical protein [Roseateles chitinivorans]|uniref:hypothetical protein n=1 Tax=Roseateles chitinivorans TaxID=2917965 RepID=UPI003D66D58E